MWIRRSAQIINEWNGPDTFVRHLGTGLVCKVGTEALAFLDALGGWQERESYGANEVAVDRMCQLGLLEILDAETKPEDRSDADHPTWAPLGLSARAYHRQTLDAEYLTSGADRDEVAEHIALDTRRHVPKCYDSVAYTSLPAGDTISGVSLEWTLRQRRTTRRFTPEPVTWEQLSTILFYSFGIQGSKPAGPFGQVPIKASPAAGARHETEGYVISLGSNSIEPGVFHYHAANHSAARIADLPPAGVSELVYHQPACIGAPVILFATTVLARLSEKYRHPRAYRLWMYDVGHVGQTLALTATALGLGVFQTISFRDTALAALIGADPNEEFPSYLFSIGHPVTYGNA
jgi:SagB-type dehydrogenase family enzyme